MRDNWIATKKELLRQVKSQVDSLLGDSSKSLRPHIEAYSREFNGEWVGASHSEVVDSMLQSRVVIAGDFHAFAQSQRAHLRLLRSLPSSVSLTLMLECLLIEDQQSLDDYVSGEISEKAFLNQVNWEQNWGFPWDHYRPLVLLAKAKGFGLKAMNSQALQYSAGSIEERELSVAEQVRELREADPNSLFFILYGDLHLSKNRLPKALREVFDDQNLRITRIFQNSEELYFDLLGEGLENQIEVLKSHEHDTFCVLSSPPWVKWQSYLIYLEQTFDLDLEDEDDEDSMDFTDHVCSMVGVLAADFELKVASEDLAVYSLRDDFAHVIEQPELVEDQKSLLHFMETERSFILPEQGILYLSRFSINHAASLAGMYVHFQHQPHSCLSFRIENCFEVWIWIEAVAFFFSKWINHKRKPDSLQDLKAKFSQGDHRGSLGHSAMLISLKQRLKETSGESTFEQEEFYESAQRESLFASSKILGSMLGERLYQRVKGGWVPNRDLQKLLSQSLVDPHFQSFYYRVVRQLAKPGGGIKI